MVPTGVPTIQNTTSAPTNATGVPTVSMVPSVSPSLAPTGVPTIQNTTSAPTNATGVPTVSMVPSVSPSLAPTGVPTIQSTTSAPTNATGVPTVSMVPSVSPSLAPTGVPTIQNTTSAPTNATGVPTVSMVPSVSPSLAPTGVPTIQNTTSAPTNATESQEPSEAPSISLIPTLSPTALPSEIPTLNQTSDECLVPVEPDSSWSVVTANSDELNTGQHEACFVLAKNGKAYLIGGRIRAPVCEYDISVRTWKCSNNNIPLTLNHMQCVPIGDDIWIVSAWTGSFPDETDVPDTYVYSPLADSWSTRTGLPPGRVRGSAAAVYYEPTNSIFVSHGNNGGHNEASNSLAFLDRYDIDTDTWVELADGIIPRDHVGGAIIGDELCIAGGRNGRSVDDVILPTECCKCSQLHSRNF